MLSRVIKILETLVSRALLVALGNLALIKVYRFLVEAPVHSLLNEAKYQLHVRVHVRVRVRFVSGFVSGSCLGSCLG